MKIKPNKNTLIFMGSLLASSHTLLQGESSSGCWGLGTGRFQQCWGCTRAGLPPADLGLWAVPAAPALPLTPPIAFPSPPEAQRRLLQAV